MNINSLKQHGVMPEIETFKDADFLKLCKKNAPGSLTKKFSQIPSGFLKSGKILK